MCNAAAAVLVQVGLVMETAEGLQMNQMVQKCVQHELMQGCSSQPTMHRMRSQLAVLCVPALEVLRNKTVVPQTAHSQRLQRASTDLALLQRVLSTREAEFGPHHPQAATVLNSLGSLHYVAGRYSDAVPLIERALAIREGYFGSNHRLAEDVLNSLAELRRLMGYEHKDVLLLCERALAICEARVGPKHLDTANNLTGLALLHKAAGTYVQALPLMDRALAIHESWPGPGHPVTADSLNNLAELGPDHHG